MGIERGILMANARRRRQPIAEEGVETPVEGQPGETQVEIKMKGGADDITRRLGAQAPEAPLARVVVQDQAAEKDAFVKALRNAKYIIRVKRVTPRDFNGVKTNVEVWNSELPLSYQEIQEEVAKTYKGGKYRVAVVDPSSNSTVAADTFEVDGDPFVPETEMTQEEQDRLFLNTRQKSASELSEEDLERSARLTQKQIEFERLRQQLSELKGSQSTGKSSVNDTRIEALERNLERAKQEAELERRDREHQREIAELKAMIARQATPPQQGASDTALMLKQMQAMQASADQRFGDMMKTMQDDKMNALMREVQAIKNKPAAESGGMVETMKSFMIMAKMMGMNVPGSDDDDDEDDVDDKRPWWERALDKLGGKFGDKLLAKFTDMEEKGEVIDREKFMAEMSQYADQVAADAAARQTNRLPAQTKPPGLPAPPATAPVQQLPPPPPAGGAPATQLQPPPPPAALVQQNQPALTVEQEVTIRVGTVLDMLDREATFRANEYHWNYEGCWMALPDDLLEKVCAATDGATFVDALTTPLLTPEKIAELKAKLTTNPKTAAWFMIGLNELKEWHQAKQSDPMFDPFADDEEEGAAE